MKALRFSLALVLFAALGPAFFAADEPTKPTKKELETAAASLKTIGIGMHEFCDRNDGRLPDDVADKDGRFVLSWRVAILPFVGEEKLFKEFKLDEPWDGPNNKKLVEKMPKLYAPARGKAKAGETFYNRFVGKDTCWTAKGAHKIFQITDGTSNTALVLEAADPLIWTQPGGMPFNVKAPLPGLGGPFDGDFHVLMGDGSVYLLKKGGDQDTLKLVIMPDDATVIDFDKLLKK